MAQRKTKANSSPQNSASNGSSGRRVDVYKRKLKGFAWGTTKIVAAAGIFIGGGLLVWAATFDIPDLASFQSRQVPQSTKIYDRTGEVVLYDLGKDFHRTVIPFEEMGENVKEATIAVEDEEFYDHRGIDVSAIFRAIYTNVKNGNLLGGQGGSTITQQVVKNTLLTPEKKLSRKVKEWFLALRIEQDFEKDEILTLYLNEVPYGGTVYGIKEAADTFFGKDPADLSVAEAAYLAALPKAPSYYSPFGSNQEALEVRQNQVIEAMYNNRFITEEEYEEAKAAERGDEVVFVDPSNRGIKAPHFVFYVIEQLEQEYGSEYLHRAGLEVVTTLNWNLQQEAQSLVTEYAERNEELYNAENASLVALDPKSGQILTMVGSRDYNMDRINGAFNAATASRQPGSSFKPFVYATAFNKGYTDRTVLFNLRTQFSTACDPWELHSNDDCYAPINYDGTYTGPISLRNALAQSVNVPAVKLLYLVGPNDALNTAERMGITTLDENADQYGLTLVLGSGEVTLLDLSSAYGGFATEGIRHEPVGILQVETTGGEVLESYDDQPSSGSRVISADTARMINSILSDNAARTPAFGARSPLYFPNHDVAAKTGTTNDYNDMWTIGYTPNLVVGTWAGNNDGEEMEKEVAGFVLAPLWNEFMQVALNDFADEFPNEKFSPMPNIEYNNLKPILAGTWQGGLVQDSRSPRRDRDENEVNGVLTRSNNDRERVTYGGVHTILHWVDKNNPRGPVPTNPAADSQYHLWEHPVREWVTGSNAGGLEIRDPDTDDDDDDDGLENTEQNGVFRIELQNPRSEYDDDDTVQIGVSGYGAAELTGIEAYVNDTYIGYDDNAPFMVRFTPEDVEGIREQNTLRVVGSSDEGETTITHQFEVE